ncbi:MAG: Rieske 2Fe-2S domain-containing protein [Spirochaetaceae bacterium]|nr:Rieske 2Fe-2S domain-containing protein [Myxococcales bacterium]MCB9722528.1 Rieske 2Fe-2S domain-containing protein [Spirochaetaceae bacterium]HPG24197.1 Rieske 2Fe-2S domain-containing protein [Myxococcota bacterium]
MTWHRVALPAPLRPGEKAAVEIAGREVLVARLEQGFFAVSNRCTHAAWPLAGEPIEGLEIVCTLHGARFDLRDGCPTAGPARKPLAVHPIELREGELFVRLST